MTKADIRAQMRRQRTAVDAATRRAASHAITSALLARAEFRCAHAVACFLSLPQEIATDALLAACHTQGKLVCVPAWDATAGNYILARLRPSQKLIAGPHGVPEPAMWQVVDPQTVDMVIVPGLAFDKHGGRLGYGKGYYDRILSTCRATCIKVGVGYAWQVVDDALPLSNHDVSMDLIITECGIIE